MSTMGIGIGALADLLNATTPKYNKKWEETQSQTNYAGIFTFAGAGKPAMLTGEYGTDDVRLVADTNTIKLAYFGSSGTQGVTYMTRTQVKSAMYSNRGYFFDSAEEVFNQGEVSIYNHIEARYSGVMESVHKAIDDELVNVPQSQADIDQACGRALGPLYWLPTLTVGATADYVGGFNGTTVTFGDTTTTTTIANQNRSTARNARLASWVCNYTGNVDDILRLSLIRAVNETTFETLPGMQGNTSGRTRPNYLWMPPTQYHDTMLWVNRGPDDTTGSFIRYETQKPILGMMPVRVPQWSSLAYAPIVGIRSSKWVFEAADWMKFSPAIVDPGNARVVLKQLDCKYRVRCKNSREGGFNIHIPR